MDAANYGPGRSEAQPVETVATGTGETPPMKRPWNTPEAVAFAFDLIGPGRFNVAAIDPETGSCYGKTFTLPAECAQLATWIEARQGKFNLHYALNEPVASDQQQGNSGRIRREDLKALRGVVLDLDPSKEIEAQPGGFDRERQRLRGQLQRWATDPKGPGAIVDSGGGVQAVFLFSEPLPATPVNIAAVERQAKALARHYGGDATSDAVHLFRLPWTVNLPNKPKRDRGREPALAQGLVCKPKRFHTLDELAALAPPVAVEPRPVAAKAPEIDFGPAWEAVGDPDALPPELAERLAKMRTGSLSLDRLLNTEAAAVTDRSKHDFAIAAAVIEGGLIDPAQVAAVVVAYSPDKFEEREDRHGRASAESYLSGTVLKALARLGPQRFFHVIEDEDEAETGTEPAPRTAGAVGFGEPEDIFGSDDPAELSTPPDGSLPDVVAPFVHTVAVQMGVPESFVAVAAVAALAGTIGNALTVKVREHSADFTQPASLAVVIVARPGRKKSPTIAAALAPIRALDRELHRASGLKRAAWRAAHCTPKGAPKAGAPPQPPELQIGVDNATVEKQVRIHADNPTGIIRHPDELSAFLGSFGAYKKSGDGDRGMFLTMLDGGPAALERVSGTVRAERALMGLIASTQPDRIAKLARDLGSDGLLQRLIPIMDDGAEREPLDEPADPDAATDYARAVRGMYEIRNTGGGTVYLSREARTILTATWRRIRTLSAIPGASAAWEGHVSKWEGFLYRIALTFHALDTWVVLDSVPTGPGAPVTAETAHRASRFALFLVRHALRFYGEFYEPAEHNAEAREIAGYLLTRPDILSVTPRDIERARRSLQGERRRTLAAMEALENFGWASVAERGADGPSRWTINPKIHERFAAHAKRETVRRAQAKAQLSAALLTLKGLRDA
ncbi:DUF3987 domain-containing protein [Methylobacterium sp. E-005]|uniref:DUF3987 domain-containing protein n=1 Tax=Methylobacterium sp. E-005 TaxID=2836549 RepID=UPI001FBB3DCD|nr:DUF3987 domain-containing protein [Methylobacterium sp. E-005]MCJ2088004.1 DUF3987 domain-containing protein [Methylobacterium sp. E-005]